MAKTNITLKLSMSLADCLKKLMIYFSFRRFLASIGQHTCGWRSPLCSKVRSIKLNLKPTE